VPVVEQAGFGVTAGRGAGLGRELGPDAPLAFTETTNVFIATN
jgi:hypothetical protein